VVRPDPFVEEEFARNEATKKPWVKAEPSSHIWAARLPVELEPGTHRVAVHVIDEYGREHRDHQVLELTGSGGMSKAAAVQALQASGRPGTPPGALVLEARARIGTDGRCSRFANIKTQPHPLLDSEPLDAFRCLTEDAEPAIFAS
jgi:hypothetical protein